MPRRISTGVIGPRRFKDYGDIEIQNNTITLDDPSQDLSIEPSGTGIVTTDDPIAVTNNDPGSGAGAFDTGALVVDGGVGITGNVNVAGDYNIGGVGINNITFGSVTPAAASFTNLSTTGLFSLQEATEVLGTKTGASGLVAHNFQEANFWYHSGIVGNFTVSLTNVPTTDNKSYRIRLILAQGGTAYLPNAVTINGSNQTIRWAGYSAPTPNADRTELVTFVISRTGGSWTVQGALTSFNETLDGSSQALAAPSAQWIKAVNPGASNGVYWINHGSGAYQNYCYMDAGGHMLVGKIASTTSSSSPWLYNGSYWTATTAQNESNCTNTNSTDGLTRGYYGYTIQSNIRLALGNVGNALTYTTSGVTPRSLFTGSTINTNSIYSRAQFHAWFQTGTGTTSTVFDNQPHCNRSGFNRSDSASTAMRFGLTMNNENECNSNDSSIGFGTYTNGQTTGPRAIPAGGHRWNPDIQYPAVGYIFAQ